MSDKGLLIEQQLMHLHYLLASFQHVLDPVLISTYLLEYFLVMKLINLEYTLLLFDGLLALKRFGDVAYHQILLSYLQSMDNTSVQYLSSYLNTLMMLLNYH